MLARMKKLELLCIVGKNIKWSGHYGKQYRSFLKILKIELLYDLVILILSKYTEELKNTKSFVLRLIFM